MARVRIGTSSWADPGFVEEWYPAGLPARDRLGWYAERFEAVEVNATFYAVPAPSTVRRWAEVTPEEFRFDVKLHRLLSRHAAPLDTLPRHLRPQATVNERGRVKLDDGLQAALIAETLQAMEPLEAAGKLAGFLLQTTPGFEPRRNALEELAGVVEGLAPHPVAVELRHRAWVSPSRLEDTLGWYERTGAVWVSTDMPDGDQVTIMPAVDAVTRPGLAYFRAHGRNHAGYVKGRSVAERFAWRYADDELEEIGARVQELASSGAEEVRVYFNNNRGDDAPVAAARMRELSGQVAAG
jgi:uncharacterized protein YecE (DUF72 family)